MAHDVVEFIMKNNRMNIVLVIAAAAALAVATGTWWLSRSTEVVPTPDYTSVEIKRGDITATVSATGTLNPMKTVQVGSQVSGAVQHLYADFNDRVEKGQAIAQIDPALFHAKLAEAQADVASAKAGLEKAAVGVRDTQRELDRQKQLFGKKLVAENILDAARFAHESAQVERQLRQAAVAQAEAVLKREEVNLAYTTIYAPIDGVVISRDVDVGQTVAASLQAPTLFTIANDLTHMQVDAEVDEAFIGQVQEGQAVSFTVFAYPGERFDGRVVQVRLQPKVESGVVKYNTVIEVDNTAGLLKPGMTANVSIQVEQRSDVLQVPGSTLRFVPDWPAAELAALRRSLAPGEQLLWVAEGKRLRPVKVSSGVIGDRMVEVQSDELKEGMLVATPEKRETARKRRFGISFF